MNSSKANNHENLRVEAKPVGSFFEVNENGFIVNPTSPEKIQKKWQPAVDAYVEAHKIQFGGKLKNVYIRGSVAKGQAIENISDLDGFAHVYLSDDDELSYSWTKEKEVNEELSQEYPFVKGFEFWLLDSKNADNDIILNQAFCVYGEAQEVKRLKLNKDLAIHSPNLRKRISRTTNFLSQDKTIGSENIKIHCVWAMKGILRSGLEILLEKSGKYSRDLYKCYEVFSEYYPEHEASMRKTLELALNPSSDRKVVLEHMNSDFIVWLVNEAEIIFGK